MSSRKAKDIDHLEEFFETNVLGIFACFNDSLKDPRRKQSTAEKIRTLRAVEEMIRLAKRCVGSAIPQVCCEFEGLHSYERLLTGAKICACLQEAMETESLRPSALSAWATMMLVLQAKEVGSLLGQTFSVLLRHWENLEERSKDKAVEMVTGLFDDQLPAIEENLAMIPSLASVPLLSSFEGKLNSLRASEIRDRLQYLTRRCRHENVAVVEQALIELTGFIKDHQGFIHTAAISENPDGVVPELIRTLLDVIVAYKNSNSSSKPRVERLCAESLGLVGAVDPNRVEAHREKRDMMVLHNFDKADESVAFVVFFLEERVVKAFLSTTDTKAQGFLAFGMQELLKFIDVESGVVLRPRNDVGGLAPTGQQRWDSFSQTSKNILTPFLKSKYTLQANNSVQTCTYPVFSLEETHRSWLQKLLLDLLSKPSGDNAANIFSVCRSIIKDQDISIAMFLLPFVTLNVIIGGTDQDRDNIASELLAVLRPGPKEPQENPMAVETQRQCSEVSSNLAAGCIF